jgi:preprotein translocase subunit SecD
MGKGVKAAIKTGHHRAFAAVTDSNMTQIIASLVLIWLGSGTILGFAITLLIGSIISMFTAIYISKWLLNLGYDLGITKLWLYGGKKGFENLSADNGKKVKEY